MPNAHRSTALLPIMLKKLRLATIRAHWQEVAEKAIREHWPPEHYLVELCQMELAVREERRLQRYLKEAKLLVGKNLSSFDFTAVEGVSKRSEEHTSELQSRGHLVCRLLLAKKENMS